MLEHAGLAKSYWGEAVMTATFLRNRCPTRAINHDKSPHQVWIGKKPLLAILRVAGFWYCVPVTGQPKPVQSEPTLITPPRITPLLIMPPVGTRL
ncbi:unnamed protein product [Phytophthora lilii]|uniref:Unnamed protein product n=1 Tax=Phytophthora lilii TaxID=2077276 RepID=A0A9W6YCZ1_9STRA|nr:unnamed protein product [Phytophthora lilii]